MTRPFRRLVLYVPGFDPMPPRRYRELYRCELHKQALIGGYDLAMERLDGAAGFGWTTRARFPTGETQARIEVLVWADLVQASMRGGIMATYWQMLRVAWRFIRWRC